MKTNLKRILSLGLAMVLAFSSLAITVSAEEFKWDTVPENATYVSPDEYWAPYYTYAKYYVNRNRIPITGDGARDAVAMALSQVGYLEGGYSGAEDGVTGGGNNYTEYGAYTAVNGAAWCASFCSWAMYTAKVTSDRTYIYNFTGGDDDGDALNMARNGGYWGESYVPHWSTFLNSVGRYRYADYYIPGYAPNQEIYRPKTGDLAFFISSTTADWPLYEGHVGLVVYSDDTYVYTVEGNTSSQDGVESEGGGVFFKKYQHGTYNVAGYGILPYETVPGLPEIDYSGANPTPGIYINPSASKDVYEGKEDSNPSYEIPMSTLFEVQKIEEDSLGNTMLYAKFELDGKTKYGWIIHDNKPTSSYRTLQIYATPDSMEDCSDELKFTNANITITDDIALNFKASESALAAKSFTNPYVVYEMNGVETTVTEYNTVNGEYVFDLPDIAPHQMNDKITATLYATKDDVLCLGETVEYSIKEYCYNILANNSNDTKLRTLIVDLLNYGAKSQEYVGYKVNSYVNADLTATQKAWGTSGDRNLVSVLKTDYATVANPSVKWKGAGLNLKESVGMRFRFETDSLDGITVKVVSGGEEWTLGSENFETTINGHYVFFEGLSVAQMSDEVFVTAYKNGVAVSNTLRYSIESYANAKLDSDDSVLVDLVKAMMRYGDSAKKYNN